MSEDSGISNNAGPSSGAEPSMEEILASIRRILTEEENERAAVPQHEEADDDIFVLDSAMVSPNAADMPQESQGHFASAGYFDSHGVAAQPPLDQQQYIPASVITPESIFNALSQKENYMDDQVQSPEGLVSDKAASEIANTFGSLVRSVSTERSVQVGRPGVTIEDLVREEIKPVLKAWLDSHLPSLVERVVRAEIGRVVDRMQS